MSPHRPAVPTPISPAAARIHGWATVLAPLLLLLSTVAYSYEGGLNNGVLGGTFGVWSTFAFATGLTGIHRLLEPAAPRLAPALLAAGLVGFTGGAGFNIQAMYLAGYGTDLLEDLGTGELPGASPIGALAFLPWGLLVPLVLTGTGLLLWRTHAVPTWSALLLAAGGVLFVLSRPTRVELLALAADLVLVVALAVIGRFILTRRLVPAEPPPGRRASAPLRG